MINYIKSWFKPYEPKFKVGDVLFIETDVNPSKLEQWEIDLKPKYKVLVVGKNKYLLETKSLLRDGWDIGWIDHFGVKYEGY